MLPEETVVAVEVVVEVPSSGVHPSLGEGEEEEAGPLYLPQEEVEVEELLGPSGKWVDQEGEGDHH